MQKIYEQVDSCFIYEFTKKIQSQMGHLAVLKIPLLPWIEIHANSNYGQGKCFQKQLFKVNAFMIIDPVTNSIEIL